MGDRMNLEKALELFPADKVHGIWDYKSGDGMIYDFSGVVPIQAIFYQAPNESQEPY